VKYANNANNYCIIGDVVDTFIRHKGSQHKIEKTDRQTDKLCTEITEEKTERKTATNATMQYWQTHRKQFYAKN